MTKRMKTRIQTISNQLRSTNRDQADITYQAGSHLSSTSSYNAMESLLDREQMNTKLANQLKVEDNYNTSISAIVVETEADDLANTMATKAVDELDTLIRGFTSTIEGFFQPFYPREITEDLHEDFIALSQCMFFKEVNDCAVYKTLAVLVRVDSQINDKDLRDKRKLFQPYTPLDFGVEDNFCMMAITQPQRQMPQIVTTDLSTIAEDNFCSAINQSQVKVENSKARETILVRLPDEDEVFEGNLDTTGLDKTIIETDQRQSNS